MQPTENVIQAPRRNGKRAPQPLGAADFPDAHLTGPTVLALSGLSASSLAREVKAGKLVAIRMGTRCTRYRAGDVTDWLRAKATP